MIHKPRTTHQLLQLRCQIGKTTVEFRVDGQPTLYRADFSRMVQRNTTTGKERALRSLLSLLIKDQTGQLTQTVEINMPHDTLIRDLRKELANYLKHEERLLRLMYGNRVLRRADYQDISIKDGIVPLGADQVRGEKGGLGCVFI